MKKRGKKKREDNAIAKKLKHEKLAIIVMIVFIVILAVVLAYDMYTSFKERAEAEAKIAGLNENLASLITSRDECVINRDKYMEERDALNKTVIALTNQRTQLNNENDQLTEDLAELQSDYDALESELASVQSDLDDCEAALAAA